MTYDLTKVSERFRALEDGRRLKYGGIIYNSGILTDYADEIVAPGGSDTWSLVPETKQAVTKLWVYQNRNHGDIWINREEFGSSRNPSTTDCLGAIEGSEQTEEVDQ